MASVVEILYVVGNKSLRAGETLEGVLKVYSSSKPIDLDDLEMTFEGEEYASVVTKNQLTHSWESAVKKHTIYSVDIKPAQVSYTTTNNNKQQQSTMSLDDRCMLPWGSYEFKFSIQLPLDLPSSTVITHDGGVAKIEYSLNAVLRGCNADDADESSDQHTYEVIQVQAPTQLPTPAGGSVVPIARVKPYCHTVRSSFLSTGEIYTGAQSENSNLLIPGEQLRIDLALINESRIPIENVRVVLRERVRWSAMKRKSKTIMTNLVSVQLGPDVLPDETEVEWLLERAAAKNKNPHEKNKYLVTELLKTGTNVLSIALPPVPKEARNTYVGSPCVSIHHEAIITLESKRWKKFPPQVRIPVKIVGSQCKTTTLAANESFRQWCRMRSSWINPVEDNSNLSFKKLLGKSNSKLSTSHHNKLQEDNENQNDDDDNNNKPDPTDDCNNSSSTILGTSESTLGADLSLLTGLNPAHESLKGIRASQRLVF